MIVSELIAALQSIGPDAKVQLYCHHTPGRDQPDHASGDVLYVAVTNIDDSDEVVILSNCVSNKRGDSVFDAPPQFKRFKLSSKHGPAAAIADLQEQAGSEPTKDLATHLEVVKMKNIFHDFESLLRSSQPQADE